MEKTVPLPAGITASRTGDTLEVKGPKGTLARQFRHHWIEWKLEGGMVTLSSRSERRRAVALLGTYASHIRNMCTGVVEGYEAGLKVVFSHFPIKLSIEGSKVLIQNFLGERAPRSVEVPGGVKVEVKKEEVLVSGIDKEAVGQAAGRIEGAARVTGFDRRVFQDGIHLVAKAHPAGGKGK